MWEVIYINHNSSINLNIILSDLSHIYDNEFYNNTVYYLLNDIYYNEVHYTTY